MTIELKARSTLDTGPFDAGIRRMKQSVKGFGSGMGGSGVGMGMVGSSPIAAIAAIAAAGAVAMYKWASSSIRFGSALKDQSEAAGLSATQLQRYNAVAIEHGQNSEIIVSAIAKIRDQQGAVVNGNKAATESFSRLGISQKEVAASTPDELFRRVARAFQESNGSADAYNATADILGAKTLPQLSAILKDVGSGLENAGDQTKILSESSIEALDRMGDKFDEWKLRIKVGLAEAFVGFVDFFRASDVQAQEAMQRDQRIQERKDAQEMARQANIQALEKKATEDAAKKQAKIQTDLAAISDRAKPGAIISDTFSKVGGAIGGSASPQIRLAERSVQIQTEQARYLAKIEANTKDSTAKVTE